MVEQIALDLQDALAGEIEVIEQFTRREEVIRTLISENNWEGLKDALDEIKPVATMMEEWENTRAVLFRKLREAVGESENAGFYQVIVHLPHDRRNALSVMYRRMKTSILQLQGITWSIDAYVRAVTGTMNQILNEMYPHRKGNLYAGNGAPAEGEASPLLLNHRL